MLKKLLLTTAIASASFAASTADLEARIEELELARDLNYWNFSGELETRYDTINSSGDKKQNKDGEADDFYSLYARINIEAKPSDRFTFFGRLSMAKYMNSFTERKGASSVTNSGSGGRSRTGSELYVERAFFNYDMTSNLTFSAGRLPTIDGPSDHLSRGSSRSGTYPKLAYGAILDGFALTHTAKILGGGLSTRFIYTPLDQVGFNPATGEVKDSKSMKIDSTEHMWSAMLDYENVAMKGMNRLNVIAQQVVFKDFYIDTSMTICQRTPTVGKDVIDGCTDGLQTTSSGSNLRFDYNATVLYVEMNGIANTGLDLGLSYKITTVESRGSISPAATLGFNTSKTEEKVDGTVLLANARYSFAQNYSFGFEYIDISKDAFNVDFNATDPVSFYGTAGSKGKHVYATANLNNNLRLVAGYMMQDVEVSRTEGVFGDGTVVDVENKAGYFRILASF